MAYAPFLVSLAVVPPSLSATDDGKLEAAASKAVAGPLNAAATPPPSTSTLKP